MVLPRFLPASIVFWLGGSVVLLAQTAVEISWGSSVFEQKMILSDGTALDPSNLIIEFGSFDASFQPDHSNMSQWLAQWRVFDAITDSNPATTTTDSDPNDGFTNQVGGNETARYAGMAHLLDDATSNSEDATPGYTWSAGEQGYLFIRTSDDFVTTSEWLLLTSQNDTQHAGDSLWQFPAVTGGQPQYSEAWWLDDADTAVFGAVAGGSGGGGDTGMGDFTDNSTDFVLRLHALPEPQTPILVLLPALLLLRRQRLPASASRRGAPGPPA